MEGFARLERLTLYPLKLAEQIKEAFQFFFPGLSSVEFSQLTDTFDVGAACLVRGQTRASEHKLVHIQMHGIEYFHGCAIADLLKTSLAEVDAADWYERLQTIVPIATEVASELRSSSFVDFHPNCLFINKVSVAEGSQGRTTTDKPEFQSSADRNCSEMLAAA